MRAILLTCLPLLASLPMVGCGDSAGARRTPSAAPARQIALRYRVEGMHCDGCVQAITDKLKHVDGVIDCRVSLEAKQADVSVRDASTAPAVQQAIEKLGYKVTPETAAPARG